MALKQIILKSEMKSQLEVFREISTLRNCDHENVGSYLELVSNSLTFNNIFTDYKAGGDSFFEYDGDVGDGIRRVEHEADY